MFLALSKILPALLFPVGLTTLLCLLAAWLAFRKGAAAAGIVALFAAILLYAAASPVVKNRLFTNLERQNPPPLEYSKAAAIVLLGGGMAPFVPPRVHPETNMAGDRLLHAARLWKMGLAPKLVTTGGHIRFLTDPAASDAELYAVLLKDLFDVPAAALLTVPGSKTTADDAAMTAELFAATGMRKDILLVTSASHMPRAAAVFRKHGFTVHPAPTDYYASERRSFKLFDLMPSAGALMETEMALKEHLGFLVYRMMGRL